MSVLILPECPVDCTSTPASVFYDECAPAWHYGEISKIYEAGADSADFVNVEDPAEWATRLSDDGADPDAIRTLIVIGELGVPDRTETLATGGRTSYSPGTYTLPFEIDEVNDINYLHMLTTQCNVKKKYWFETSGGLLFGGNTGIEAIMKLNQVVPRDREEKIKFIGELKWRSQFDPLRCVSPLA